MVRTPYPAAVRLALYWLHFEADISGQCILRGVALEELALIHALDVIYTLILDEADPPRREARDRVDTVLERPFDAIEADEFDRARWGTGAEAQAAAAAKDAMFAGASYDQ